MYFNIGAFSNITYWSIYNPNPPDKNVRVWAIDTATPCFDSALSFGILEIIYPSKIAITASISRYPIWTNDIDFKNLVWVIKYVTISPIDIFIITSVVINVFIFNNKSLEGDKEILAPIPLSIYQIVIQKQT